MDFFEASYCDKRGLILPDPVFRSFVQQPEEAIFYRAEYFEFNQVRLPCGKTIFLTGILFQSVEIFRKLVRDEVWEATGDEEIANWVWTFSEYVKKIGSNGLKFFPNGIPNRTYRVHPLEGLLLLEKPTQK